MERRGRHQNGDMFYCLQLAFLFRIQLFFLGIRQHETLVFHNLQHQRSIFSKQSRKQKRRHSFQGANLSVIGQKAHDTSMKILPLTFLWMGSVEGRSRFAFSDVALVRLWPLGERPCLLGARAGWLTSTVFLWENGMNPGYRMCQASTLALSHRLRRPIQTSLTLGKAHQQLLKTRAMLQARGHMA